ncbi:MAG: hypothetical protein ACI83B_003968 [Sediminicola sp.]|jgi:hypothetical protein
MKKHIILYCFGFVLLACNQNAQNESKTLLVENIQKEPILPEATEIWEPKPKVVSVDASSKIPSDALVLFDGSDFNEWISAIDSTTVNWNLNSDKSMTVRDRAGDIQTKKNFGSVQLHIEWRSSKEIRANGQNRSNSGVFFQNRYEVQILDNNNNDTYVNGQVGAIYKQAIPLVKASSETGKWNSYDIIYHAPKFNSEDKIVVSATITVLHNGVLIQDHVTIKGTTEYIGWPKNKAHGKAPIKLQDHGDNSGVSYRNIWVREL